MKVWQVRKNVNLDRAVKMAQDLGATVEIIRRKGEYRFSYPGIPSCIANCRRKDTSRAVIKWIRDLAEIRGERARA